MLFLSSLYEKKVLALVLALMMAVSLMVTASAKATFADVEQVSAEYQEAVEVLQALGIMIGNNEAPAAETTEAEADDTATTETTEAVKYYFHPKDSLRRDEFATVLFKLITGDDQTEEQYAIYKDKNYYDDVPATNYARVAINYLHDIGSMKGIGGDDFGPAATITGHEVLVAILQALGYNQLGEFGDTWAETKLQAAVYGQQKNITTGMNLVLGNAMTREQLAGVLFNTLTEPEAHVVALKNDGKNYVEEWRNIDEDEWKTLGEVHWGLHLFSVTSGTTYPEDKALLKLDPFGRPMNPKWVAYVDGKRIEIGTDSKTLKTYFQKDAVTRSELEKLFYETFSAKDMTARTEYYVDGELVTDPWAHATNSDYDKIGGTGVTVEAYLMADNYTAVSSSKDADRIHRDFEGDTTVTGASTWPRLRVVIVHHYAALITEGMYLKGDKFNSTTYATPDRLVLPYDNFVKWNPTHTAPIYEAKTVNLPLEAVNGSIPSDDTYKVGDVIYFDVAISTDANGDKLHTVYNDINLTDEGCMVEAPIVFAAPDKTYIRLTDNSHAANYITYFMWNTTTENYKAKNIKVDANTSKKVYLDPVTKQFVALIVNEQKAPAAPTNANTYYYVESVKAVVEKEKDVSGREIPTLDIIATLVDFKNKTREEKKLYYDATWTPYYPGSSDGYWEVSSIGFVNLDNKLRVYSYDGRVTTPPGARGAAMAYVMSTEDDPVYNDSKDTVYTVAADINLYLDGKTPAPKTHPYVLNTANSTVGKSVPLLDNFGNLIFFYLDEDGTPYIVDRYDYEYAYPTALSEGIDAVDTALSPNRYYNAYSSLKDLLDPTVTSRTTVIAFTGIFTTLADININRAVVETPARTPDRETSVSAYELMHQFVTIKTLTPEELVQEKKDAKDNTWYDITDAIALTTLLPAAAYDRDIQTYYKVSSDIFTKNETSSKVDIVLGPKADGTGDADPVSYYVTANTKLYAALGEKDGDGYKNVKLMGTYSLNEFEEYGTKDTNPDILVVLAPDTVGGKTYNNKKIDYIIVISDDAVKHDPNTSYYGIYCGLDETGASTVVCFVNPGSNTIQGLSLTSSAEVYYKDDLKNASIGDVLQFTTKDGKIDTIVGFTAPETVIEQNTNYIVTAGHTYNLYNPHYYLLVNGYIYKANRTYIGSSEKVGVFRNYDGTTTVVIYSEDYLKSAKDGLLYFGNIDANWDGRN